MESFVDFARCNGVATLSRVCDLSATDVAETCAQLNCSGEVCKVVHLIEDFSPVRHYSTSPATAAAAYADVDGDDSGTMGGALGSAIHLRLVSSRTRHMNGGTKGEKEEEEEERVLPEALDKKSTSTHSETSFRATPYSLYFPSIIPHRPVIPPVLEARPSSNVGLVDLREGEKGSRPQGGGGLGPPTFRPRLRFSIREHPLRSRGELVDVPPHTTSPSACVKEEKTVKAEPPPSVSPHAHPCGPAASTPKRAAVQRQKKEEEAAQEEPRIPTTFTLPSHRLIPDASLSSSSLPLMETTVGGSSASPPAEQPPSLSCLAAASPLLPPTSSPSVTSSAAPQPSLLDLPRESLQTTGMNEKKTMAPSPLPFSQKMESRMEVPHCSSGGGGGSEILSAVPPGKSQRQFTLFDMMMMTSSGPPSKRRKDNEEKTVHNVNSAKESIPPTPPNTKKEPKKKKNMEAAAKTESSGGVKKKTEASSSTKIKPLLTNSLAKLAKASGKGSGAKCPVGSTPNGLGEGEVQKKSFLDDEEKVVNKEEEEEEEDEACMEDGMCGSGDREKELYNEEWNAFSAPLGLQETATNDNIELCDDTPPFVFSRLEKPKGATRSGKKVDAAYATISPLPSIQDRNTLQSFFHPSVLEFQQKFKKDVETEMKIVNGEYICREVVVYRAKDEDKTLSQEEYNRRTTELAAAAAASLDVASQNTDAGNVDRGDSKNADMAIKRKEAVPAAPSRVEKNKVQKLSEKSLSFFFSSTSQ